jgi:hypothetical protein
VVADNQRISQEDFVREWFRLNPDRDIPHLESKPLIEEAWLESTGSRIEDVDRAIRKLSEAGELVKIRKGVYRFNSTPLPGSSKLEFSEFTRQATLERDSFCCAICKETADHRRNLHVIPITPFDFGGLAVLSNARTVCSFHKVALELLDKNGDISSTKVRNVIDRILYEKATVLGNGLVLAEDLLQSLERHIGPSGVNWRELT